MVEKELGRMVPFESLSPHLRELLAAAERAMEMANNPISHFFVGAAVLTRPGKIFLGANYESANMQASTCAERAALTVAINNGHLSDIVAIAVITRREDSPTTEISFSCGTCRQLIGEAAERSRKDIQLVFSTTKKDKIRVVGISELFPLPFGFKDLEEDPQP